MVHIWGFVGSISGPLLGQWVVHVIFHYKNGGFRGFLLTKFSERGAKFSSLSGVLVQSQAFKKGMVAIPFFIFCCGGCWWMLLLDCEKRVGKKNYKTRFFCHPLLERRKKVKRRERPEVKKTPPFLHCFLGALKRAGSSSTFLGKKTMFENLLNPCFLSVSRKS